MPIQHKTLILQEYGPPTAFLKGAETLGLSSSEFRVLLERSIRQIDPSANSDYFIEYYRESFRLIRFAGILTLSQYHKIEIVPKYLSPESPDWREDFLWIAAQSRYGSLFSKYLMPVSAKPSANLSEILARAWLFQYEQHQRIPIRNYKHAVWQDYSIDGEPDEEDILLPPPNGFAQAGLRLSTSNTSNLLLLTAAEYLHSQVSSPQSILRLDRATTQLMRAVGTAKPNITTNRVLSRHQRWMPLLELSRLIAISKTVGYAGKGPSSLPGYVLRTQDAWEHLVFSACRRAFHTTSVEKRRFLLGTRQTKVKQSSLRATPDICIMKNGSPVLVDAKYKATEQSDEGDGTTAATVSGGDIYEALAFMGAAGINSIHLVYPSSRRISDAPLVGQPLEVVEIGNKRIIAVSIGVSGIASRLGFHHFVQNLATLLDVHTV